MASVIVRSDPVEIFADRQNAFWTVVGIKRGGILSLIRDGSGQEQIVLEADDETLVVPRRVARHLDGPPAPFGIQKLSGFSLRLDLDGDRRIVSFTGMKDHTAMRLLNQTQRKQVTGGLPTPAMLADTWSVMRQLPGFLDRSRECRAAWTSILQPA